MKILLFGGNGQLGTELRRSLASLGELVVATRNGQLVDGTACETADFDHPEALPLLISRIAPAVVVNAAAYTAVDNAETHVEAAFRANAEAPGAIAGACAAGGALLIHYSTDYVFDGRAMRPYREDDPVAPLGVYGASKLGGENAIRTSGALHLIFRTAWVYAAHGRNFLLTMLRLARERDELRVVADQIGSPTSAALIADVTAEVLRRPVRQSGLWHLTTHGQTTWHGFAEAIVAGAHARGRLERRPVVIPIDTAGYPTPARRPHYSCLDSVALESTLGMRLPDWQADLEKILDSMERPIK